MLAELLAVERHATTSGGDNPRISKSMQACMAVDWKAKPGQLQGMMNTAFLSIKLGSA